MFNIQIQWRDKYFTLIELDCVAKIIAVRLVLQLLARHDCRLAVVVIDTDHFLSACIKVTHLIVTLTTPRQNQKKRLQFRLLRRIATIQIPAQHGQAGNDAQLGADHRKALHDQPLGNRNAAAFVSLYFVHPRLLVVSNARQQGNGKHQNDGQINQRKAFEQCGYGNAVIRLNQ